MRRATGAALADWTPQPAGQSKFQKCTRHQPLLPQTSTVTPRKEELLMRTYDPMSGTIYVRMTDEVYPHTSRITSSRKVNRLPRDYANKSLRTRLRQ